MGIIRKLNQDFTTSILVDKSPHEVFKAITNPRAWWSAEITGGTEKLNDEFHYQYEDLQICTIKLVEVVPSKKVVWHFLKNYFKFTKDTSELTGTAVSFEIFNKSNKTQLLVTCHGLAPELECYQVCCDGWNDYIHNSMFELITKGKGTPLPKK